MSTVRVSAPSAHGALELQRRIGGMCVGLRNGWAVELETAASGLEQVDDEVVDWLRDLHAGATVIAVDGVPHAVAPR